MHYRALLRFIPVLLLTGCAAGMDDEFSCSTIDGIEGCATMNDINTFIDEGQYATDSQGNVIGRKTNRNLNEEGEGEFKLVTTLEQHVNPPLHSGVPSRYREEVKEIVIYPYQDAKGNYHDTSVIYTILTPSHWLKKPPTDIIHSQYQ